MKKKFVFNFFQNECLKLCENIEGIYNEKEQEITFFQGEFKNMINFNSLKFVRENQEYAFELNFIEKKAFLNMKYYNIIDINVLDCNFEHRRLNIYINYCLETEPEINNRIQIEMEEK